MKRVTLGGKSPRRKAGERLAQWRKFHSSVRAPSRVLRYELLESRHLLSPNTVQLRFSSPKFGKVL